MCIFAELLIIKFTMKTIKFISYTNSKGELWCEELPKFTDPELISGYTARLASIKYHVSRYGGQIHAFFNVTKIKKEIDYSIKNGDEVMFSFLINPEPYDWIKAKVLDVNWSCKSVAIQLEGFSSPSCVNVINLYKFKDE